MLKVLRKSPNWHLIKYHSSASQSGFIAVLLTIIIFAVLFAGALWLKPLPLDFESDQPNSVKYDLQGTMLKVVRDLNLRHIKLTEGSERVLRLNQHMLLVKRQKDWQEVDEQNSVNKRFGIYLIEAVELEPSPSMQGYKIQTALVDETPQESAGIFKIARWGKIKLE
jgi:hypothetical protein